MQNKYFGDVGDFGKYRLLTAINNAGLKLGVNWYLTKDDKWKNDGKFIEYLELNNKNREFYKDCDPVLYDYLKECIENNNRNVKRIEEFQRFNNITFYTDVLDIEYIKALSPAGRQNRFNLRNKWFMKSVDTLNNCDVIFCDPDNGLENKTLSKYSKDSIKYVYYEELSKLYMMGKSIVVYNHIDRTSESIYREKIDEIRNYIGSENILFVLRYKRYNVRDYIFILHKEHFEAINNGINEFLASKWGYHFEKYYVDNNSN